MKAKMTFLSSILICIILAVFGIHEKMLYQDFNKEEDPFLNFQIGVMNDEMVEGQIQHMRENLVDLSPIIVVAECKEKPVFRFKTYDQSVEIKHVFKGTLPKEGEIIKVVRNNAEIYMDDVPSINMSFVNQMKPGNTYLIFLDRKINNTDNAYMTGESFFIAPIFSYEEIQNVVLTPTNPMYLSVSYNEAKENEFFFMSEGAYFTMKEFKEELLSQYVCE